jgi:hypothetical protein
MQAQKTRKTAERKTVIWVHGNAVEPEEQDDLMHFARKGWGAQCKGMSGATHWFHFPVCSPSLLKGSPMYLSKLYLMFNTMPGGKADIHPIITTVHVYDGRTLAMSFEKLALAGVHDEGVTEANTLTINPVLRIANGLGLSVAVEFPMREAEESVSYEILFTATGVEFA